MTHTYWNSKGKYQELADALQKLVPDEGECSPGTPLLEKFRKATNCYYDYYNNGLCNRADEFRRIFGFGGNIDRETGYAAEDHIVRGNLEKQMNKIILLAASESLI